MYNFVMTQVQPSNFRSDSRDGGSDDLMIGNSHLSAEGAGTTLDIVFIKFNLKNSNFLCYTLYIHTNIINLKKLSVYLSVSF